MLLLFFFFSDLELNSVSVSTVLLSESFSVSSGFMLFKLLNYTVFPRSHKTACCSKRLHGVEHAFSRSPDQTASQMKGD